MLKYASFLLTACKITFKKALFSYICHFTITLHETFTINTIYSAVIAGFL